MVSVSSACWRDCSLNSVEAVFSNRDYVGGCFLGGCATCFYMVYMSPEDECGCRFPDV